MKLTALQRRVLEAVPERGLLGAYEIKSMLGLHSAPSQTIHALTRAKLLVEMETYSPVAAWNLAVRRTPAGTAALEAMQP